MTAQLPRRIQYTQLHQTACRPGYWGRSCQRRSRRGTWGAASESYQSRSSPPHHASSPPKAQGFRCSGRQQRSQVAWRNIGCDATITHVFKVVNDVVNHLATSQLKFGTVHVVNANKRKTKI